MLKVHVYVVTVTTFFDRHVHIRKLARKHGFEFEFVWKYDADDLDETGLARVDQGLSHVSASNVLKHFEAQRMFLDTDADVALVLEDDVIFFESFFPKLEEVLKKARELSPGWLIFLGGADNKIDRRFMQEPSIELIESPITTAEAYVMDRFGVERRLEWIGQNLIDCQADHQLKKIDQALGLKQYRVSKPLATQGSITGKFVTMLDSSRAKRSGIFLALKYMYNRSRRQIIPRFIWKAQTKILRWFQ